MKQESVHCGVLKEGYFRSGISLLSESESESARVVAWMADEGYEGEADALFAEYLEMCELAVAPRSDTLAAPVPAPPRAVPTLAAVVLQVGDECGLRRWLEAASLASIGARVLHRVTVVRTDSGGPPQGLGPLPFDLCFAPRQDGALNALRVVLSDCEQDVMLFSTTDVTLDAQAFERHIESHRSARAACWMLGAVAGAPGPPDDGPLLQPATMASPGSLPHAFPSARLSDP